MFFFKSRHRWENWSEASGGDFIDLTGFILPRENSAVPFSSRLLNIDKQPDAVMLNRNTVVIERNGSDITGAVMLSPEGIICPVFTSGSIIEPLRGMAENSSYFKKRYITLMGTADDVKKMESVLEGRNSISIDYNLLSAGASRAAESCARHLSVRSGSFSGTRVHRASPADTDRLMPLRKAYELEEVLLNPASFNENACRRRFADTIAGQAVFFAEKDGKPVATSCINAGGIGWLQLGGVFTLPEFRSKGLSAMLMAEIANYALSVHKDLTLFVKKDNAPANRLYRNCGFTGGGDFRITYLESR